MAAETPAQRVSVMCKHCGRRIAQVTRIRDLAIAVIDPGESWRCRK